VGAGTTSAPTQFHNDREQEDATMPDGIILVLVVSLIGFIYLYSQPKNPLH
jgi:hypothetical protein